MNPIEHHTNLIPTGIAEHILHDAASHSAGREWSNDGVVAHQHAFHINTLFLLVHRFPTNTGVVTCHDMSALRVEVCIELGFEITAFVVTQRDLQRHSFSLPGSIDGRFLIDWKDAREEAAEVAVLTLDVVLTTQQVLVDVVGEDLLGDVGVVEHPFRIGSDFVIASESIVFQCKLTVSVACLVDHQFLAFHQIALLVEQFDIEDAAYGFWFVGVGRNDVCFVPDGIACEIAVVVEMQVHFLLCRQFLTEQAVGQSGHGVKG